MQEMVLEDGMKERTLTKKKRTRRERVSVSNSSMCSSSVEEDEDMAKCLILLAQGGVTEVKGSVGSEVYQCKTCDRSFGSFQALGGHRTGHKKVKEETSAVLLRMPLNEGKTLKAHVCGICGAEFSSGQALGGHMRRHRRLLKSKCITLDLNLPPQEEDDNTFCMPDQATIVYSASLVGC